MTNEADSHVKEILTASPTFGILFSQRNSNRRKSPFLKLCWFCALVLIEEVARASGVARSEGGDDEMEQHSICKQCAQDSCEYCEKLMFSAVRCTCYDSDPEGHFKAYERLMGLVFD
jgi:hypothetical protein